MHHSTSSTEICCRYQFRPVVNDLVHKSSLRVISVCLICYPPQDEKLLIFALCLYKNLKVKVSDPNQPSNWLIENNISHQCKESELMVINLLL